MDGINHHRNQINNQHNKIIISQTLDQYNHRAAQIGVRPNQILERTGLSIHINSHHQHRFVLRFLVSNVWLLIQSDRGPGGDQNISWNGQSQTQPPTSQAPPTQTGTNSAGALSTPGSDWNRPPESHSGITWGGSMMTKNFLKNFYGVFRFKYGYSYISRR